MTTKKEPMPDIEISEADHVAAKELMYRKWHGLSDAEYEAMFIEAFARHRLAATAAERERIIKDIDTFRDSLSPSERGDLSATYAIARILAMLQPTTEATA
jgi:hypothetical protein